MRLLDAQAKLLALKQEVLQTSDVAACLKITISHASQILRRLSKAGFFFTPCQREMGLPYGDRPPSVT